MGWTRDLAKSTAAVADREKQAAQHVRLAIWAGAAILAAVLVCSYWQELRSLLIKWRTEEDYNHGFLVPPFAAFLLWYRRELMPKTAVGSLWGLALLAVGAILRWGATLFFMYDELDPLSMWCFLAGAAVFVGGLPTLRWSWPAIFFLVFMIPLPGPLATTMGFPLQRIGAAVSTYLLQTIGIPATSQGVVITLTYGQLEVERACSGLRMLMLFVAVCVGAAILIRRPLWEKAAVVLSAPPIAVAANVLRITITGVLSDTTSADADAVHTVAGWLMMPLAVLIIWGEMALLERVFVSPESDQP